MTLVLRHTWQIQKVFCYNNVRVNKNIPTNRNSTVVDFGVEDEVVNSGDKGDIELPTKDLEDLHGFENDEFEYANDGNGEKSSSENGSSDEHQRWKRYKYISSIRAYCK